MTAIPRESAPPSLLQAPSGPSHVRLPSIPPSSDQYLGRMTILEEKRDVNFEHDVEALAHILFQCPATIQTFVEHWMALDQTEEATPHDSITQLLMTLLNHNPILQITSRRVNDALQRFSTFSNMITFLTNFKHNNGHHDFELSDKLLAEKASDLAEDRHELYTLRLETILMGLLCHNAGAAFTQCRVNTGNNAAIYSSFRYNDILKDFYDRSAYVVALLRFLIIYCAAVMPKEEGEEGEERAEEPPISFLSTDELTRQESGFEVFGIVDTIIRELRSRCPLIESTLVELPDALCVYDPAAHDWDKYLFGVPTVVVASDINTLLWLEWAWKSNAWRATTTAHSQTVGLKRLLNDLWRAKSILLYYNYYDFFARWDEQRLRPFLERLSESLDGSSSTPSRQQPPVVAATI